MKLLLAGGGTAGHIEPALAVARAWRAKYPNDQILFIGTASGLENTLVPAAGFELQHIPKVRIPRRITPALLAVPFQLISSIATTMKLLRSVDCAIGFGGYVSGPLYFAAALLRKPFVIHEQNAHPGWANQVGARFTKYLAISYPIAAGPLAKAERTGLPLRADVLTALNASSQDWARARESAKSKVNSEFQFDSRKPLIFIFGGSQGSQAINQVIAQFLTTDGADQFNIVHGVGKNNPLPAKTPSYIPLNYINEMADLYLAADLLIARSGAVTCAEATALARFSLFIPLPIGNGEQALNAQELIKAGRADLIDQSHFTSHWLASNIPSLLQKSSELAATGDARGAQSVDKILRIIERAAGVQ